MNQVFLCELDAVMIEKIGINDESVVLDIIKF